MSGADANEVDAAVTLIREAMETRKTLNRTPHERVSANGIATVLEDVIRRMEALGGDGSG